MKKTAFIILRVEEDIKNKLELTNNGSYTNLGAIAMDMEIEEKETKK